MYIVYIASAILAVIFCVFNAIKYGNLQWLRRMVKRIAVGLLSFSSCLMFLSIGVLAWYPNVKELLTSVLSVSSIDALKTLIRIVIGTDSAFVALQMIALSSLIVSFISCLVFAVSWTIRYVFNAYLRVSRVDKTEDKEYYEHYRTCPQTFKIYSKFNS